MAIVKACCLIPEKWSRGKALPKHYSPCHHSADGSCVHVRTLMDTIVEVHQKSSTSGPGWRGRGLDHSQDKSLPVEFQFTRYGVDSDTASRDEMIPCKRGEGYKSVALQELSDSARRKRKLFVEGKRKTLDRYEANSQDTKRRKLIGRRLRLEHYASKKT